jgi:hypothetical protein
MCDFSIYLPEDKIKKNQKSNGELDPMDSDRP